MMFNVEAFEVFKEVFVKKIVKTSLTRNPSCNKRLTFHYINSSSILSI